MRVSISKLMQLQHLQWCSVCNKVNETAIDKPSAVLIARFRQHFHSHWDSPALKVMKQRGWGMPWILSHPISGPGYSVGICLAHPAQPGFFPATDQARAEGTHFSALGRVMMGVENQVKPRPGWSFAGLLTPQSEKGGPGQKQHSFEFLLITFSHNFMVENSSTLPSYLLFYLSQSLGLGSSLINLLMTRQNMKVSSLSRVTLIMTCPFSGP